MYKKKLQTMTNIKATFTVKNLILSDSDKEMLFTKKEFSYARTEAIFEKSGLCFDDIERLNNHYENHSWGSTQDRKYRVRAIKKAIDLFSANPYNYITWTQ